jgi:tetratricopeptide (TPR) repeat protein
MDRERVSTYLNHSQATDSWQVAYIRSPTWVDEGGAPYRPMGAMAVSSTHAQLGHSDLVHPLEMDIGLILEALESLTQTTGFRPTEIQVADPDLAERIRQPFAADTAVTCCDDLPLIGELVEAMTKRLTENEPFEPIIQVPGVEIEHIRRFADAALAFSDAVVWERLESVDIIEIEAPRPSPDVRFGCVLGAEGQYGLGFAAERRLLEFDETEPGRAFDALAGDCLWSVTFHEPWEIPIVEHDAWLDHDLAIDFGGRIPAAIRYGPKRRVRRASPRMLAFFEAMFHALAWATDDELDSGSWSTTVETSEGPLELSLSLPDLLAPPPAASGGDKTLHPLRDTLRIDGITKMLSEREFASAEEMQAFLDANVVGREVPPPRIDTPQDEARELALEAMGVPGRRGIAMARRALAIDPDCAYAHLALAERSRTYISAADRFKRAMKAATKTLGEEIFLQKEGRFWVIPETRPYLHASAGYADSLVELGHPEEALTQYTKILRLNEMDNLGVRGRIVPLLVELGRAEAAAEILARFPDDTLVPTLYNRALVAFWRDGDDDNARTHLTDAVRRNRYVPEILLDRLPLPDNLSMAPTVGSIDEAGTYLTYAAEAWETVPGAMTWLDEVCSARR